MTAALIIAAAGALLIVLVMFAVPSVRRGAGLPTIGAVDSPHPSPFRATAVTDPGTEPAAARIRPEGGTHEPPVIRDIEVAHIETTIVPEPHVVRAPANGDAHEHALASTATATVVAQAPQPQPQPVVPAPRKADADPAPDLLASLRPVTSAPEQPTPAAAATGAATSDPESEWAVDPPRAPLRDHSLGVPIVAIVLVAVTVLALRRSRRR